MKLTRRHLERDRSGVVTLVAEEPEDMWHAYNLICTGDLLTASTVRRLQLESDTGGSKDSQRVRMNLTIATETVEFDTQVCTLRVNGRVARENQHVKMGAYHTIDLELHRTFTVHKQEWDSVSLDRIRDACDVAKRAEIMAVTMQEGLANICLITESMTIVRQRIEVTVPKKRRGTTTNYDKGVQRFFEQTMDALVRHANFDLLKVIIIASPGFVKDQFHEFIFAEASRRDMKQLFETRSKFLLVHCSSGHKNALTEETRALDAFFEALNVDPDRAYYGWDHVRKAGELGAVASLLLTDELFRSSDVAQRRQYIALVDQVRSTGGTVHIFSTLHVSGEQLKQITGVAAVLSYPCPHIEEELEAEAKAKTDAASSTSSVNAK